MPIEKVDNKKNKPQTKKRKYLSLSIPEKDNAKAGLPNLDLSNNFGTPIGIFFVLVYIYTIFWHVAPLLPFIHHTKDGNGPQLKLSRADLSSSFALNAASLQAQVQAAFAQAQVRRNKSKNKT